MEHLKNKNLLTIFTYAPAGLGHLRVTDALYDALPKGARHPILLGSHDEFITFFHRLSSNNPLFKKLFEPTQKGVLEVIVTVIYRSFLRFKPRHIYNQLLTIMSQSIERPDTLLIVATHPFLAHQVAAIKHKFEKDQHIRIYLVVQVTDDTPTHLWYVPGADLMFVPSKYVKKKFLQYGHENGFKPIKIQVNGYPVSPKLLSERDRFCDSKLKQVMPGGTEHIHVMVPLSGAAVGIEYLANLISAMTRVNRNYRFHIVGILSVRSLEFLNKLSGIRTIDLHMSRSTREVVNDYETVYRTYPISLEITKPSEQSFKALLKPGQVGGSILLFTKAVGIWEEDNLAFLRRHNLIPSPSDIKLLQSKDDESKLATLYKDAGNWRGLQLPENAEESALFINKMYNEGFFMRMMNCNASARDNEKDPEVDSHGAIHFWKYVDELLSGRG